MLFQADGREVHLGLIYPCLLGAGMLGSTLFPWFVSGPLSLRTEDCLLYAFSVAAIVLSVVAYDYHVRKFNYFLLKLSNFYLFSFQHLVFTSYLVIACAGNWSFSDTFLLVSCLRWPHFTFTCKIENIVKPSPYHFFFTVSTLTRWISSVSLPFSQSSSSYIST